MRTLFATAAIVALIVFGLGSAAWGQQGRTTGQGGTTGGGGIMGAGSAAQGLGGPLLTREVAPIEQRVTLEAGEFIGTDVEEAQDVRQRTTRGGITGQAGRTGQTGRGGASPFGSNQLNRAFQSMFRSALGGGRGSTEIRARLVARIPVNRPPAAQVSSQLAQRIQKSSWVKTESPVEVTINQGTATLRGVVASDHDRRLAERMAKLEPGVRRVANLLTVAASPTPAQAQPTLQ